MKKNRKLNKRNIIAMFMACIMALGLIACGEEKAKTTSVGTSTASKEEATVTEVTQPEVTAEPEVTEPATEAPTPEPTEELTPTEAPAVDNPNIIDGYDFTDYNESDTTANYSKVVETMNYDSLRFIVRRLENDDMTVVDILADGDQIKAPVIDAEVYNNEDLYFSAPKYLYYFYFPKEPEIVEVDGMSKKKDNTPTFLQIHDEEEGNGNVYCARIRDYSIITPDGYNLTGHVVYTDGTEETIVITIYPED